MAHRPLKIGETVVISNKGSYGIPYSFQKIRRLTKAQLTTEDGRRWMISNGSEVGSSSNFYKDRILFRVDVDEATSTNNEWVHNNYIRNIRNELSNTRWGVVSPKKLERIKAILNEPEPEQEK